MKEDIADHYYAPWQVFVIEELNFMHTIEENYVVGQKRGWSISKKDIRPTKLFEYFEPFHTVSNFRMQESLIWHDITFGLKQSVIEGTLNEQLIARTIEAARQEYEKHPHASWIEFVRKLVELYNSYLEKEKIRLSDEIKSYLTSTLNMIMDATQKSFEEVSNDYDGRFKGHRQLCREKGTFIYPGELERIFPDELKQIKERAGWVLDSYIKQFNVTLSNNVQIEERIKDDLIDSIIESGHELLLSHLHEIEELWFNHRLHWKSNIWAHLRSLAVSIESVGQEWYGQNSLGNILKCAFKEYGNLRDFIGKNITDAETPEEYKQNIDKILAHKETEHETNGICGNHLIVAHLTRNYLSHKVKFEPDMLGSIFLEIYKALVLTLISLFVQKTDDSSSIVGSGL
ncbi:MAG: hypothetical protein ABIB41_00870 [Nitrospirota bacterium]